MKRIIYLLVVLTFAVFCSACINNYAVNQLNKKAKQYSEEGNFATAVSRLESSVELDGNIFESRFNLAVAYYDTRQCEKALPQIKAAEEIKNDDAAVYYVKGSIYTCLAENVYSQTDKDNQKTPIVHTDAVQGVKKASECIEYLKEANTAYERYIKLASNTDQNVEIYNTITENKKKIEKYKNEYGI